MRLVLAIFVTAFFTQQAAASTKLTLSHVTCSAAFGDTNVANLVSATVTMHEIQVRHWLDSLNVGSQMLSLDFHLDKSLSSDVTRAQRYYRIIAAIVVATLSRDPSLTSLRFSEVLPHAEPIISYYSLNQLATHPLVAGHYDFGTVRRTLSELKTAGLLRQYGKGGDGILALPQPVFAAYLEATRLSAQDMRAWMQATQGSDLDIGI